jgi:hypothetical protein
VKPGVLERCETPLTVLANGDEGLDGVAFGYRLGLAAHNRPADRVHQGNVGAQEPHVLDLPYQAAPFQPLVEELLVERSDLLTPFEVCAVEADEIAILREDGGEGVATALVPAIHHLLIESAEGCFVGGVVRFGLVVHGCRPFEVIARAVVSVVSGHSVVPFELLLSLEDARLMIVEAKLLEDAMSVLVLFSWEGDPDELLAAYDRELEHPVAREQPRRLSHTCARSDDGVVIVDVWQSREDFQTMMDDPEFQKNLQAAGWPTEQPQLVEVYEVHASIP